MNALPSISFEPAYRQLRPSEKAFVDGYVAALEKEAVRSNERLSVVLQRVPNDLDALALDMLSRSLVKAAIVDRVRELSEQAELNIYKTLKTLRSMAYSSIADYIKEYDAWGVPAFFAFDSCTPEQMEAVKSVEIEDNPRGKRKIKIVLHDKMAAMGMLMKYQGLLDSDDGHWMAETAKAGSVQRLPASYSDDQAADAYGRLING